MTKTILVTLLLTSICQAADIPLGAMVAVRRTIKPDFETCKAVLKKQAAGMPEVNFTCEVNLSSKSDTEYSQAQDVRYFNTSQCNVVAFSQVNGYVVSATPVNAPIDIPTATDCIRQAFSAPDGLNARPLQTVVFKVNGT